MKCSLLAFFMAFLASSCGFTMLKLKPATKILHSGQNLGNLKDVAESLGLTKLIVVATSAGVASILEKGDTLTLFGPTNEAFASIPEVYQPFLANATFLKEVLEFHLIKPVVYANAIKNELLVPSLMPKKDIRFNVYGGGKIVTAQCSRIIKVNQNASNGVIHVVNRVLIPPFGTVTDLVKLGKQYFSKLLTAVITANLQDVLAGPGPFTVFAPTDEAFDKIPPEELKKILKNIPLLTKILKYHVVSGTFCSAGLTDGATVPTLEGSDVTIRISGGSVMVNNANVIFVDAPVSNGVVHVIDTVLIPKDVREA